LNSKTALDITAEATLSGDTYEIVPPSSYTITVPGAGDVTEPKFNIGRYVDIIIDLYSDFEGVNTPEFQKLNIVYTSVGGTQSRTWNKDHDDFENEQSGWLESEYQRYNIAIGATYTDGGLDKNSLILENVSDIGNWIYIQKNAVISANQSATTSTYEDGQDNSNAEFNLKEYLTPWQIFNKSTTYGFYKPKDFRILWDNTSVYADTANDRIIHFESNGNVKRIIQGNLRLKKSERDFMVLAAHYNPDTGVIYLPFSQCVNIVDITSIIVVYDGFDIAANETQYVSSVELLTPLVSQKSSTVLLKLTTKFNKVLKDAATKKVIILSGAFTSNGQADNASETSNGTNNISGSGSNTGNSVSIRWTTAGIDSVKIRQTNTQTGCFKDTIIVVTIQPSPTPVISGSAAVCSNSQNNSYSVVNIPGHVYQWYAPTKGVITGSGTASSVNVHWTVAGVDSLKVRQTNPQTGCFKDTTLLITIQGLPTPVITGKSTVCISENDDSYSIANIPGHVYQWFVPIKGTVIGSVTSNSVRIQWKSSGIDTIKVRQTNPQTGCYKDTTLIVVISAQPSQSISGVVNPCANNRAVQYSVPLKNNYSYQWGAIVRGTILGSRNGNSIEVVWKNPGIDSLTLRTTNTQTGCTSDTSFVVRISSAPLPVISGTRSVCVSANPVEYSVPTNSNSRYSWSQPKLGTLIGVNDGNTVRIRWNTSGYDTVNVRETDLTTGCSTDTFVVVNVLPQPKPIITGNAEVVEQEKGIVYSVQSENGSTYEWIIVSGDANITTKSGHLVVLNVGGRGAVVLKVIQTNVDGCINESQFVITVKAPTSVQDESHSMFTVYPNPTEASDELLVQIADLHTRVLQIELVDMMGVTMVKTAIELNNGIIPLNIHGITSGMYIVRVHTPNGIFSEKVIVN
jgi:hypothetical protein